MTRLTARIDDLTCCRAIFACWVFIYHLNLQLLEANPFGVLAPLVVRGYLGVDGFFILSGLVLAHAHPRLGLARGEIGAFWARRLARIYPVHFAVILLLILFLILGTAFGLTPRDPTRFDSGELVANLLLVHGWGASTRWAWNYPSWTISTEWAGYLAFPLLWWGVRRLDIRLAFGLLAVMPLALAAVEVVGGPSRLNLAFRIGLLRFAPEFTAGMLLARCAPLLPGPTVATGVAIAGGLVAALGTYGSHDSPVVIGLGLLLGGLYARGAAGKGGLLTVVPGFVFAGTISYSFYMSFAVVEMAQSVLWRRLGWSPAGHVVIFALFSVTVTFVMAVLLWRFVERPGLRLAALAKRPPRG